jgi:hypothetical protein
MSATSARALAEKKVRRQKLFVAVGSVVLLALLGFELPKVLGGGGSGNTAPTVTTASPGAANPQSAVAPGRLPDTDRVVVARDSDQLLSFGLFKSKDPFVQQISARSSASVTPAPVNPPPASSATKPAGSTTPVSIVPNPSPTPVSPPTTTGAGTTTPTSTTTTPSAPPGQPTSVLISTNGVCETVALNGTFPTNEDIFRVVSIARNGKSVRIGVVGGSYDSGQATATLKLGQTLTLVNTADGTRYVIALKTKCEPGTHPASTTKPAATTPVPAAPPTTTTTTATTPIVTDSVDTTVPSS